MNRTNVICLLLAVAGLSFGIGQTVGQDRAEAGAQAAKVQKVKDTQARAYLKLIFRMQVLQNNYLDEFQDHLTLSNTVVGDSTIKTLRGLLRQICENTEPNSFSFKC